MSRTLTRVRPVLESLDAAPTSRLDDLAVFAQRLESSPMFAAGAASRASAELFFSLYSEVRRTTGLRQFEALAEVMRRTNGASAAASVDSVLADMARLVMDDMYAEAVAGASIDFSKIHSIEAIDNILDLPGGPRARTTAAGMHNHHTVPRHLLRDLIAERYPNMIEAEIEALAGTIENEMPGYFVHKIAHNGEKKALNGFHQFVNSNTENGGVGLAGRGHGVEEILSGLEEAYRKWGRPDVWRVAREWLILKDLIDP